MNKKWQFFEPTFATKVKPCRKREKSQTIILEKNSLLPPPQNKIKAVLILNIMLSENKKMSNNKIY